MTRREWQHLRNGLLFLSPCLIGLTLFVGFPFMASLYLSFTSYDGVSPPLWVGVRNYFEMAAEDPLFYASLWNTFYFVLASVPLGTAVSIGLALLLNMKIGGQSVYRTIFYLPAIVPVVASAALWMWIYNPQFGLLNMALHVIGIDGPAWLIDPFWAKPALVVMSVWGAGQGMLIYLAGLQEVPVHLHEAATIDGASPIRRFWHVTLPMLSPVILFNVVMGTIGAFNYFTQAYMMTGGGPLHSTTFYALYVYNRAFNDSRFGYACALSWVLFVIVAVSTMLLFRFSRRHVHYEGG